MVFKVDRRGKETVVYSFTGGADGAETFAGVVRDEEGNLYGTTYFGGAFSGPLLHRHRVRRGVQAGYNGKESVLYAFTGGADGANPIAGLFLGEKDNLYGTASDGGAATRHAVPPYGSGVVFKIARDHCAEEDETTEMRNVVLPNNVREFMQLRLRLLGTRLGPQ